MCGIAGILSLAGNTPVDRDRVEALGPPLRHRGPDDAGTYIDPQARCGLAFRRLSIIDLEHGNQPIANEDGSVQVVFNGEIYNFRELRRQLRQHGHHFRTDVDSEVIAHAYEQYGQECFARLEGMFAIAIWDAARGRLTLARDRFGKKPLACAVHEGRLYFASEAKAILALPDVSRRIDPDALHAYLLFQYVPAPQSIFEGFFKLLPAHTLVLEAGAGEVPEQRAFWTAPAPAVDRAGSGPRTDGRYESARRRLGELLTRAVERRLIADVPLGAFLSGGVDSTLVVGLMRQLGVSPLRTFTIGFDDPRFDESAHAEQVARHFETEHHAHVVRPDALDVLDRLAWHYDEPFADSSAIPTWYLAQWTAQSVKVALTGDGGDEGFAGYDRYRAARLAARADVLPGFARRMLAEMGRRMPRAGPKTRSNRLARLLAAMDRSGAQRYLDWILIFRPDQLEAGYRPDFRERVALDEPLRWFAGIHDRHRRGAAVQANCADLVSYLPYDLLTKVDIASMAWSLECRCPLLDRELVEFAFSLPYEWRAGKRILKDCVAELVPREIFRRPKSGFGVPLADWLRGPLRPMVEQALFDDGAVAEVFRRAWLEGLFQEHQSARADHAHRLWALLTLDRWARVWQPVFA